MKANHTKHILLKARIERHKNQNSHVRGCLLMSKKMEAPKLKELQERVHQLELEQAPKFEELRNTISHDASIGSPIITIIEEDMFEPILQTKKQQEFLNFNTMTRDAQYLLWSSLTYTLICDVL